MGQIQQLYKFIAQIKNFFNQNDFLEIITPPLVENPGVEPHIHPFKSSSCYQYQTSEFNYYLNTSPEFKLKECLSRDEDLQNIYSLNYSFRDEPQSPIHRPQFLMLEWYRKGATYHEIMSDCELLLKFLDPKFKSIEKRTISSLFEEYVGFDPTQFSSTEAFKQIIKKRLKNIILPEQDLLWEDYFFLVWLNNIEPKLIKYPALIVYEYPAQLAAFAEINSENPKVCLRFELYLKGVEIANCYQELTNYEEMKKRIESNLQLKSELYKYQLPMPNHFLKNFKDNYPPSSGIALGVQRLFGQIRETNNIFLLED